MSLAVTRAYPYASNSYRLRARRRARGAPLGHRFAFAVCWILLAVEVVICGFIFAAGFGSVL
jgi:hypothetical protein